MNAETRARLRVRLAQAAALAGAILSVSACSTSAQAPVSSSPVEEFSFTGPYAAQFEYGMRAATSEFARQALSDGVISEQEFSESWGTYTNCLADGDITIRVNFDGSYETSSTSPLSADDDQKVVRACSDKSDEALIGALFFDIRRNPANLDDDTIIAECLRRKSVVSPSFSAEDLPPRGTVESPLYTDPVKGPDALERCRIDPLGLEQQ